jgi:hypothetical protein
MFTNGVKVPYSYPRIVKMLYQLLAESKGIFVKECMKEAGVQNREPMYTNMIEGPVPEAS